MMYIKLHYTKSVLGIFSEIISPTQILTGTNQYGQKELTGIGEMMKYTQESGGLYGK